jgi:hypothetical protein
MVSELSPDVVILDLSMPGMNGFETAANIVTIAPSTRIVLYSGHEVPASAQWVGADAFVSKSSPMSGSLQADLCSGTGLTANRINQFNAPGLYPAFNSGSCSSRPALSYRPLLALPNSPRGCLSDFA